VDEVFDRQQTLSNWRRPDGGDPGLGTLPFSSWQISPPDALEDLSPDDINFMEATGNEGATFERSYHRATLVLWPSRTRLAVVNQAGLPATLPYLADLADRWVAGGEDQSSPLWTHAHELSGHMLASWPRGRWGPEKSPSDAAAFLASLSQLGDTQRIDDFLANVSAGGAFGRADNEGVLPAVRLLSKRRKVELFEQIIAANTTRALDACADLLARAAQAAVSGKLDLRPSDLIPAATALLAALPGDPARPPQTGPWGQPRSMQPGIVVDVLTALGQIESGLADTAADIILAWPKTYDLDAVLVPAILTFGEAMDANFATLARLRAAALAQLQTRIALPLAPPSDWTRASTLTCSCDHCRELGRFLGDPARETWSFKAPQADRTHVENKILNEGYDLDCTTLRRGSPHSLVCTKNQASYERMARQRKKDLEDVAQIEAAPSMKLVIMQ